MKLTHNWKEYKWIGDKWGEQTITNFWVNFRGTVWIHYDYEDLWTITSETEHTPEQLVKLGYLEEVKENKELPVYDAWISAYINSKWDVVDHSILEKLREELDKMKTENTDTSDEYTQWVLNTCGYLLDLLSSLETKEEPVPPTDKWREQYLADHPEELARQPQEDIELLSFDYEKLEENVRDVEFEKEQETRYIVSRIGKHLELLTSTVNQLIKANNK